MSHPYSQYREKHPGRKRASEMAKCFASGGKVSHPDEAQDRKLIKKMMAEEESVEGRASGGRLDKYARGGKAKGKKGKSKKGNNVNILIAPKEKEEKVVVPPPMPGGPGMMAGPGGPPPMGPPPGGPPMPLPGMKRGGKVPMKGGAETGVGRLDKVRAQKKAK